MTNDALIIISEHVIKHKTVFTLVVASTSEIVLERIYLPVSISRYLRGISVIGITGRMWNVTSADVSTPSIKSTCCHAGVASINNVGLLKC